MTRPTLLIATWNRGKVEEIRSMLGELQVSLLALQEVPGMGTFPEAGATYEENAVGKAIHYSQMVPYLTVADDSGLEVEALGGKPGIFSARFAGEGATSVE
ncbi:MAG: non-canonical purine NTP pyrophosphatase, partial [Acidobacteria bacterium]|nr:non-canonical purine NTP pyrophosphatase [Acidobacteriota bacterium]